MLVIQNLWDQGRGRMWEKMQLRMHNAGLRPRWIAEHLAVLEAVKARNSAAAREAMQAHLAAVEEELDDAWNAAAKLDGTAMAVSASTSPDKPAKVKS